MQSWEAQLWSHTVLKSRKHSIFVSNSLHSATENSICLEHKLHAGSQSRVGEFQRNTTKRSFGIKKTLLQQQKKKQITSLSLGPHQPISYADIRLILTTFETFNQMWSENCAPAPCGGSHKFLSLLPPFSATRLGEEEKVINSTVILKHNPAQLSL